MTGKLKYTPDRERFNRYCEVSDDKPTDEQPMVAVHVDPGFALTMLIENLGLKGDGKTYRCQPTAPRKFTIPLRGILGPHEMSPYGPLKEIDPSNVTSLRDVVSPYGTGIDYEKLIEALYDQILAIKDSIMKVIDMPRYVHEFTEHHFKDAVVDREAKTVTVPLSALQKFSNPYWPARCIRDIIEQDKYSVLLLTEEGKTIPYEQKLVWPPLSVPRY